MRCLLTFIALLSLFACQPAPAAVRVATFNVAMGLEQAGELGAALSAGDDMRLKQVSEILQRVRPDIVLLNEFDYDPDVDVAALLNDQYLSQSQNGQQTIRYDHHFRAPVNTGIDSGLDLDGDGQAGGPGDAWGYGTFPGQYGMLVLSRFPIEIDSIRTFLLFPWSSMPDANRPVNADGSPFHSDPTWEALRLSSKSHWDLVIRVNGSALHLLVHHPTPPVFDGPEDRNGLRNFDENRFWIEYTQPGGAPHIVDDSGHAGGIGAGAAFVIAGDFNADPNDGDSVPGAVGQLLEAPWIDASCEPASEGALEASALQGQINLEQEGDPANDTADFSDRFTGNLRLDYLLPSRGLTVQGCGVFWPAESEPDHSLVDVSDHRLVWLDIEP